MGTIWFVSFLLSQLMAGTGAGAAAGGIMVLMLIAIVAVHGSMLYGWPGFGVYLAMGTAIGFGLEASSVANGFPFGSYVHNTPGPKPLGVPIQAIVVYVLAGWYAWAIGRSILLDQPDRIGGAGYVAVPLVAAFILCGLDYPNDPIGATIKGDWTYAHPGGQFGVPLSNYLGWIFTGWVLFQLFSLIEKRFPPCEAVQSRRYWLLPCLMWLAMPLQFVFSWLGAPGGTVNLGESTFVIADIHEAALIGSLFSMVLPALIAIYRLVGR
ncbi:carotenoid biosynthesis protein [Novosphingobium malaysiense]|uniref:carotenoid biosynthesis protein n=1 Tax=Novosphingobium malaysiense TaxID=1348853 RepID=UPI0006898739|nr:carotenoid biosynthesis protein [Novosphingobium malaysiense]